MKAHKCSALAREQAAHGHRNFTAATPSEIVGMARAGLGADLLLANECVDPARLRAMAGCDGARHRRRRLGRDRRRPRPRTGSARCWSTSTSGCRAAGAIPRTRAASPTGRGPRVSTSAGVMGYEGHVVLVEDARRARRKPTTAMEILARAHDAVGGDVVSAGGTGTYDINSIATEIQAGSYTLMDTAYEKLDLPFRRAARDRGHGRPRRSRSGRSPTAG